MGNITSLFGSVIPMGINAVKRKIEEVTDSDEDAINNDLILHVNKKRKLKSTSQYIFKTLFEDGKESDVTVVALGKKWDLHKIYLCQSPYFHSMFSGNWKEANQSTIHIEILDENITIESIHSALGSFYKDELMVDESQVISLLATAVLLQMDSIIEQCIAIMKETVNIKTVLSYNDAACRYGIMETEQNCKEWLLHNLLVQVTECPVTLRRIPLDLMRELISSPHLYVMQTEFSVYVMLKTWVFLILNPMWEGSHEQAFIDGHKFFKNRTCKGWFVDEEGKKFASIFSSLRLGYLMHHYLDVELINSDRILPPSWLQPAATYQWYSMLRLDQDKDTGPNNLPEEIFDKLCTRCGRVLVNSSHLWRWTGYNFGLDLIMTHESPLLRLKRNHKTENLPSAASNSKRKIMYRVSVASLNDQKQIKYTKTTGIQSVTLSKNEEIRIMVLDNDFDYPLLLSANFLIATPMNYPLLNPVLKLETNKDQNSSASNQEDVDPSPDDSPREAPARHQEVLLDNIEPSNP